MDKKSVLVIGVILVSMLLVSCQPGKAVVGKGTATLSGTPDGGCVGDLCPLIMNADECTAASVTSTTSVALISGVQQTTTATLELHGRNNQGMCVYFQRTEEVTYAKDLATAEGMNDQGLAELEVTLARLNGEASQAEGIEKTCLFSMVPPMVLKDLLIRWNNGVFSSTDLNDIVCTEGRAQQIPRVVGTVELTATEGTYGQPSVAGLTGGGFALAARRHPPAIVPEGMLSDSYYDIFVQKYDSRGNSIGSLQQSNPESPDPINPDQADHPFVVSLPGDGFMVFWEKFASISEGGYARAFDDTTTLFGVVSSVSGFGGSRPGVARLASSDAGKLVSVWDFPPTGAGDRDIYLNPFEVSTEGAWQVRGMATSEKVVVNTLTEKSQRFPAVAGLSNGGYVIVWQSRVDAEMDVYVRLYSADDIPLASEFKVNTMPIKRLNPSNGIFPTVAGLANGGFVVGWSSSEWYDDEKPKVYARVYRADGTPVAEEFAVSEYFTYSDERDLEFSIVGLKDKGFIVAWPGVEEEDQDLYLQQFGDTGCAVGDPWRVGEPDNWEAYEEPSLATLTNGNVVLAYDTGKGVEARIYEPLSGDCGIDAERSGGSTDESTDESDEDIANGGVTILDTDNDGVLDGDDNCPRVKNQPTFNIDADLELEQLPVDECTPKAVFEADVQQKLSELGSRDSVVCQDSGGLFIGQLKESAQRLVGGSDG